MIRWTVILLGAACAAGYAVRPSPREVVTPVRKDVTTSIAHTGTIHSGRAVGVGTMMGGTVARVLVRPGQMVREGDPLFILDRGPLRDEIRALEATIREMELERRGLHTHDGALEFRQAARDLEKATRHLALLQREGRASEADAWAYRQVRERYLDERSRLWQEQARLRLALQSARADLALLYARLPELKRLSPAAGLVAQIHVKPGQAVTPGTPLIRLEDSRRVTVRVLVDENDSTKVRAGQLARVRVGESSFAGKVARVTPGVDQELWQAWLTIRPAGKPAAFQDGQPVAVRVVTASYPRAVVLPRRAVRDWRTGAVVYVENGGRVEERSVKAVEVDTGEMAILTGLQPAEPVILHPESVHAGQRILARRN